MNDNARKNPNRPVNRLGSLQKFRLHPLIHTLLEFNLTRNAVGGQVNAVEKSPHRPEAWSMGATTHGKQAFWQVRHNVLERFSFLSKFNLEQSR
jgi:hypothetical protein